MSEAADIRLELVRAFADDRWAAHSRLFRHRHRDLSPPAHEDLVRRIYSPTSRLNIEGFRGFAKTTYLEEAVLIKALYRDFHNCVIVGPSFPRACDRVDAIANECDVNPLIQQIFGTQKGPVWQTGKIVLSNGVCIQALGRDQSITGLKYRDWRPDYAMIDDVEDPEERRTDQDRYQTWLWLLRTFLPGLDDPVGTQVRSLGTRRGRNSLPERMEASGWDTVKYPIEYINQAGRRQATWPTRFPLAKIDLIRAEYSGDMHTFAQEYMCQAYSDTDRVFPLGCLKIGPEARSERDLIYAMYDPAKSTAATSATTGVAVWSWKGRRLRFWRLDGRMWMPDEIVTDMFAVDREYDPVWIGFEKTGLSEWALQPIRAEMVRRHRTLPLLPVEAPRGKIDFIRGLRYLAAAGEIELCGLPDDFATAVAQFNSFPRGRIDAPNAAAYALLLRPGAAIYNCPDETFADDLEPLASAPLYLAGNTSQDGGVVTAALMQRAEGEIRILADWVREGPPSECVADIHIEASLGAETWRWETREIVDPSQPYKLPASRTAPVSLPIRWIVPRQHAEPWTNVGFMQAVRQIPQAVSAAPAGAVELGRSAIQELLGSRDGRRPRLSCSAQAKWTSRALAGGYARALDSVGLAHGAARDGVYRTLMEGVEAFAGVGLGDKENLEDQQPIAYTRSGRAYKSAMPDRAERRR